jgi:hypothetical protein
VFFKFSDFSSLSPHKERSLPKSITGWEDDYLEGVPEGQRHTRACELVGHFLGKKLPMSEVTFFLKSWNQKNLPPLSDDELERIIKDLYIKHLIKKEGKCDTTGDSVSTFPDLDKVVKNSIMDIDDFIKMELPERECIVRPWLRPGTIALISAWRGIGKTWLAILITLMVTRKMEVGVWETETPAGCLHIDGEMISDELQERFNGLSKNCPKRKAPLGVMSADSMQRNGDPAPNLSNKEWREAILKNIVEGNYKVLILDNLSSLLSGTDENVWHDWEPINKWLLRLRSLGVSVVMIHHLNKDGDQRGTSGREDNIDISIKLSRPQNYKPEDGARFKIEYTKARSVYGDDAAPMYLRIKKGSIGGLDLEVEKYEDTLKTSDFEKEIISMLGSGYTKQKDIAAMVGCTPSHVSQVKRRAIERGLLNKDGSFTDEGKKQYGSMDFEGTKN